MKKKVFAFYKPALGGQQSEEMACANLWKTSWERQGWECVMLNQSHAVINPFHTPLMRKFLAFAQHNPGNGEYLNTKYTGRFSRWCAMAASGGWMTDYDVLNLGFTPEMADELEQKNDLWMNRNGHAWIFYTTAPVAVHVAKHFVEGEIFKRPNYDSCNFECDLLEIDEDPFSGNEKLFHAKAEPGKPKSAAMAEKFFYFHQEPKSEEKEKPKKKTRKKK